MIIQALVKRYHDVGGCLPGWQNRFVDYAVNIDGQGAVLEIIPLEYNEGSKRIRQSFMLPEEPQGRTRGIKPAFLCDNGGYFFGADSSRGSEKFRASGELHNAVLEGLDSRIANAIKLFFSASNIPDGLAENGNYVIMVDGKYAHEDSDICNAWNAYRVSNIKGNEMRCLISGKTDIQTSLHGKIKLAGVSMGSVPLISVNSESFASYGNTSSDPAAQIGQEVSFQYVTALNDLLQSKKHHKRFAQDTMVYWAEGNDSDEAQMFSWFAEPGESDKNRLDSIMKRIIEGGNVYVEGCDFDKKFYMLCLSPNAGRISVRFFYTDSFGNIIKNIAIHYQNLEIIGSSKFTYTPPWIILSETTVKKTASDAAPLLAGQLIESIFTSKSYPLTLYNSILVRIRSGEEVNKTKASIVKAVLIRNFKSEVAKMSLQKESTNIPYTLGRLFSVLEYLQERANGSSTIRERYFSSACSNPKNIFPKLLSLSMHHAQKIDNATWFEKMKSELIDRLNADKPFPSSLNLQEQGEFIVGYYHQQQDRYTKREEK